jgi:hypothetical protein
MSSPYPTALRVHRIERPYWSHSETSSKNQWDGTYVSAEGLVRVFAHKPWETIPVVDRPGFMHYTVIAHGFDITFREGRYRTPKGACIIAGRLVRMIAGAQATGITREQLEERLQSRWSGIYGGKLEMN